MRLEMLGTAFTCQHSDSRVLDQVNPNPSPNPNPNTNPNPNPNPNPNRNPNPHPNRNPNPNPNQLLYKWPHSREVIWPVLVEQYENLIRAGWEVSEEMVEKDVALLFGGAYEAFMAK